MRDGGDTFAARARPKEIHDACKKAAGWPTRAALMRAIFATLESVYYANFILFCRYLLKMIRFTPQGYAIDESSAISPRAGSGWPPVVPPTSLGAARAALGAAILFEFH